jgi:hypothetical protein
LGHDLVVRATNFKFNYQLRIEIRVPAAVLTSSLNLNFKLINVKLKPETGPEYNKILVLRVRVTGRLQLEGCHGGPPTVTVAHTISMMTRTVSAKGREYQQKKENAHQLEQILIEAVNVIFKLPVTTKGQVVHAGDCGVAAALMMRYCG